MFLSCRNFDASIHRNANLHPVDKFNYLKVELEGAASAVISGLELTNSNYESVVISGLALTNSNYEVAISLLQERF